MEMYKKRNTDSVTIILAVGMIVCFLATIGYNTYISLTKEKIEVQAQNSNFNTTNQNN